MKLQEALKLSDRVKLKNTKGFLIHEKGILWYDRITINKSGKSYKSRVSLLSELIDVEGREGGLREYNNQILSEDWEPVFYIINLTYEEVKAVLYKTIDNHSLVEKMAGDLSKTSYDKSVKKCCDEKEFTKNIGEEPNGHK